MASFVRSALPPRRPEWSVEDHALLYNWDVTVVDVEWCVVLMVVVLVSRLARFT